jgi:hypothetical protein
VRGGRVAVRRGRPLPGGRGLFARG